MASQKQEHCHLERRPQTALGSAHSAAAAQRHLPLSPAWRPGGQRTPSLDSAAAVAAANVAQQLAGSNITARVAPAHLHRLSHALTSTATNCAAPATLKKDEAAWRRWTEFSTILNFDPVIAPADARASPD
eukprot:3506160-Pleurochrysis_carterae.AAC.1